MPGDRKVNEDSVGVLKRGECFLFALADGLGGHSGGDIASALVISRSLEVSTETAGEEGNVALCFTEAQDALMEEQRRCGCSADFKTTLVLLGIDGSTAQWGHIGDSRLYVFRDGKVEGRTMDHSVPQMLANNGEIRDKDIRFHPDRNRMLRAMGIMWDNPRFELSSELPAVSGTSYLLCTDGFWELLDEKEMCRYLKKAKSPDEWLKRMEKKVIKHGKGKNMDNYSAIAVWVR